MCVIDGFVAERGIEDILYSAGVWLVVLLQREGLKAPYTAQVCG